MNSKNEIVLFEYDNIRLEVPVTPEQETVWLNRAQMSELFGRDIKTIGKHIVNAIHDELAVAATRKTGGSDAGYKPALLGQRLKALAVSLRCGNVASRSIPTAPFQPLCS